jgi:hypothetical protein
VTSRCRRCTPLPPVVAALNAHHHGASPRATEPVAATPPRRCARGGATPPRRRSALGEAEVGNRAHHRPSSEPRNPPHPAPMARPAIDPAQGRPDSAFGDIGSATSVRRRRHGRGSRRASRPPWRERIKPKVPRRRHPGGPRGLPGEPLRQRQGGEGGGSARCGATTARVARSGGGSGLTRCGAFIGSNKAPL